MKAGFIMGSPAKGLQAPESEAVLKAISLDSNPPTSKEQLISAGNDKKWRSKYEIHYRNP